MPGRRGNGDGNIRLHHDGRWEARYTLDGKRHSIMGKTRAEVREKLTAVQRDIDRGITTPRDERQTLGQYLDGWLIAKRATVEYGYWRRCEESVRLSIKPALGKVVLTKLTAQQVQQLYTRMLAEGHAPRTIMKRHITLRKALNDALRLDLVPRNVASLVTPPKAAHEEMETYTPEEAIRFLETAKGDRLEALYVLMLTTACRLGELLGLRWEVLDLDRAEVRITSALKESSFSRRALGAPKTLHSRRTIPLTPRAVEALREHHVRQTVERLKFGGGWNPKGLVFCSTVGTPLSFDNFRNRDYTSLIERAKLKYIRPHNLRHTAATLLLLEKVPMHVVSAMLGHSSVATTMDIYGHIVAEMRVPARDAMERIFGDHNSLVANLGE